MSLKYRSFVYVCACFLTGAFACELGSTNQNTPKGKSIEMIPSFIQTSLKLTGKEETVLQAKEGACGRYVMYIKDNELHFDCNDSKGVYYSLESAELPVGETEVIFKFTQVTEQQGKGELYVNGEKVDEGEMPVMHHPNSSLSELYDSATGKDLSISNDFNTVIGG